MKIEPKDIDRLLKNLPKSKAPEGFSDKVMIRWEQEQSQTHKAKDIFSPKQWGIAAAIVGAIIVLSFFGDPSGMNTDWLNSIRWELSGFVPDIQEGDPIFQFSLLAFLGLGILELYLIWTRTQSQSA